jgi:hypothetical protein
MARQELEVLVGMKSMRVAISLGLWLAIHTACSRSATRGDAISGILDAFRSHQIVALGQGLHGNSAWLVLPVTAP